MEELVNWVDVGKVLSSGNPEYWRELPVEVIQHLLMVALRWAKAAGYDTEAPPPDMIAKKNVLLKYQPLRLSVVVAWAWAGLGRYDSPWWNLGSDVVRAKLLEETSIYSL